MTGSGEFDLSVVVLTVGDREGFVRAIDALAVQPERGRIELLPVSPTAALIDRSVTDGKGFGAVVPVISSGDVRRSRMRAMAARTASAPIVAYVEDHVRVGPGWAVAVLSAFASGPWSAVGYRVENGNPDDRLGWASFFLHYGEYASPRPTAEAEHLQAENIAYRRDALLELGDRLDRLLEADYFLHDVLRENGHRLLYSSEALVYHRNLATVPTMVAENVLGGRTFAAARARGMPVVKRFLYGGGSVLVPFIRWPRAMVEIRRLGRADEMMPGLIPGLTLALCASAFGEMLGSWFGPARRS